jgi:oligopeptide/dipeptide ABC transporter ATP-binding protein
VRYEKMLVKAKDLKKYYIISKGFFSNKKQIVHAVDGINIEIDEHETVGLVGESGCGKTTVGRLLIGLIKPTSGTVEFMGLNIFELEKGELNKVKKNMQIIFQDPYASLNPRKTVRQILSRPFIVHNLVQGDLESSILNLLEEVGITPAHRYIDRYPHEFSGGQKQRIVIARALALHPRFVVADEAVSSLDISVRAQILNMMKELGEKYSTTFLFISHDLSVVRSFCQKVLVMYLGKIVESAKVDTLFNSPLHPYTKSLLSATPIPKPVYTRNMERIILTGDVPSPINIPVGCRFNTRCPYVFPKCLEEEPDLKVHGDSCVACHLY